MHTVGHWTYHTEFNPDDYLGFIYKITHEESGKFYVGRKQFRSTIKKPPLKSTGLKRKRKIVSDSGWATYTSSSNELNEMIALGGNDSFKFEILHLCDSKSALSYYEVYYIITTNAMTDEKGMNKNASKIPCRPKLSK